MLPLHSIVYSLPHQALIAICHYSGLHSSRDFTFEYFLHTTVMASNNIKIFLDKPSSKGVKCKQVVLTLHEMLTFVCNCRKKRLTDLIRECNIGSSTFCDIKAQKEVFKIFCFRISKKVVKWKTVAKRKLEQVDTILHKWFKLNQSEGTPVSGPMLF